MIDAIRESSNNAHTFQFVCNLASELVPEEDRQEFARMIDPEVLFEGELMQGSGRGKKPVNLLYDGLKSLQKWMEERVPVAA